MFGLCDDDCRFGLIVRACVDVDAHRRLCSSCGWWDGAVKFSMFAIDVYLSSWFVRKLFCFDSLLFSL